MFSNENYFKKQFLIKQAMDSLEIKCYYEQGTYHIEIKEDIFYRILYPVLEDAIKKYFSETIERPEPLFQKDHRKKEYGKITYEGIEKPEDYKKRVTLEWAITPDKKRRKNGRKRKKGGRKAKG